MAKSDVQPVKSQAWFDLQGTGGNQFIPVINRIFDLLKVFANENEIPTGTTFSLPLTNENIFYIFDMPASDSYKFTPEARFKVSGDSTDNFSIFTKMALSVTMTNQDSQEQTCDYTVSGKININKIPDTENEEVEIFIIVNQTMGKSSMTLPMFISFDTATGASVVVCDAHYTYPDGNSDQFQSLLSSQINPDGSISNISLSMRDDIVNSVTVAYGNDVAGGISSTYQYEYDRNNDGFDEVHKIF